MRIAFLGNHSVSYSSETHHVKSLESLGHQVTKLQERQATGRQILTQALLSDMLVVVHTHNWRTPGVPPIQQVLERVNDAGIPTVTYHMDLWFGLARQADLETDPFYKSIGWFFTVDRLMADWLCKNTQVKGRFLPAGVHDRECYISPHRSPFGNDVVFVGSKGYHPEWPYRPQLIDWLHHTYRERFTHVGPDGFTGILRGDELNRLYASSKVAIGDTLCLGFDYPWYASDRLFEAPGRGGFQIFPRIKGVDEWFTEGEHMVFYDYGDFEGLKGLIDHYIDHDDEREHIRRAGHNHVKARHTYRHRWETIIDEVFG